MDEAYEDMLGLRQAVAALEAQAIRHRDESKRLARLAEAVEAEAAELRERLVRQIRQVLDVPA